MQPDVGNMTVFMHRNKTTVLALLRLQTLNYKKKKGMAFLEACPAFLPAVIQSFHLFVTYYLRLNVFRKQCEMPT